MIETTININKKLLEEITKTAEHLNISRTEIIISLLKIVMDKDAKKAKIGSSIKYQNKSDKNTWHKFHITLKIDEYEYFLDLRKFLKMSLSKIVAYAVQKYLTKLLKTNHTDNYHYNNYTNITEIKNGYRYWQIIWGLPPDIAGYNC